jgi:PKHD-type hydroxylase
VARPVCPDQANNQRLDFPGHSPSLFRVGLSFAGLQKYTSGLACLQCIVLARTPTNPEPGWRGTRRFWHSRTMEHNDLLTKVAVWPQLLDAQSCERAIALAQTFPAVEGRVGTADVENSDLRRSQIWFFNPGPETEFIFAPLRSALQQLNEGFRLEVSDFSTGCQIARYSSEVKGHYSWHIDLGTGRFSRRKLSLSVQLSAAKDYEGGDLQFHLSGLDENKMRQQGTLIAFPSFHEHRVTPVTRGERFSLVAWVDGPPYR